MYKKIVIAGGNGFLGQGLARYFKEKSNEIIIISRTQAATDQNIKWAPWDGLQFGPWATHLEDADVLINLAGKSVDCRYTKKNKQKILDSRLLSTRVLGEAVKNCKHPPKVWINASSATIYNASFDKLMTESAGTIGSDFSMTVCKRWEEVFNSFAGIPTRQILIRTSIVLGRSGGALPVLAKLVKLGMGGHQGNGKQFVSWIHISDFCRAIDWLVKNRNATGVYNVSAPAPLMNKEFMMALRTSLKKSWGLPAPKWLLEIGAFIIRTQTELVLKSRKVYPERLLTEGFRFQYGTLKAAMVDLAED